MLHQVGVSFDLYYDARKHKIKIFQSSWKKRFRGSDLLRGYLNEVHAINSHREYLEMNLPRWVIDQACVSQYTFIHNQRTFFEVLFRQQVTA